MNTQVTVLPLSIVNYMLLFREPHPTAKIIQDLKKKCNLCVNCMENPRFGKNECCSTSCNQQMSDWFCGYSVFEGSQFTSFMLMD